MKKTLLILVAFILLTSNLVAMQVTANATQLAEIKTKVRNYLHETDTVNTNYDDTMCVEAVNTSIEYLINTMPPSCHYNLIAESLEISIVGSYKYTLPTDFKYILSINHANDTTSTIIQANTTNFLTARSRATNKDPIFFIMGNSLYVYPISTSISGVFYLYLKQPTKMVNPTDTIPLLPVYDEAIVLGAVIHILSLDNQPIRSAAVEKYLANQLTGITAIMTGKNVAGK